MEEKLEDYFYPRKIGLCFWTFPQIAFLLLFRDP